MNDIVIFYEKYYYCFSNFPAFAIEIEGVIWMTSEHAYQAAKFNNKEISEKIRISRSSYESKKNR